MTVLKLTGMDVPTLYLRRFEWLRYPLHISAAAFSKGMPSQLFGWFVEVTKGSTIFCSISSFMPLPSSLTQILNGH